MQTPELVSSTGSSSVIEDDSRSSGIEIKRASDCWQKGAPAAESNSVRLANGLRECGSKIKRINRGLSGLGQEAKPFQLEDPKNLEIIDDLNGYLGGLKYAIRQLKEQLSEKEEAKKGADIVRST
ncbi:hypothetical protein [Parasutterella excrementihominis]|uniref:hypothetical protein n=1 Tax=Parasutterella excrementihominis TaxID=487175 RepID=UPI0035214DE6